MGADYILHRHCDPKLALGSGDALEGTQHMLGMLKARSRARAIYQLVETEGRDPSTASVQVVVVTADGPQERDVTVAEMMAEAAPLDSMAPHCASCDACALDREFGCFGYLNYPLTDALERWIVERIQPTDTLGGFLLIEALRDFGYDGRAMASWRQRRELLERPISLEAVVAKRLFGSTRVSVDQILQAIVMVGGELAPAHCMGVLLWLGALRIHGHVPGPGSSSDPAPLVAVTQARSAAERRAIAQLDVGPPHEDPCVRGFQQLLFAMYASWALDTPLLMDS